MSPTGYCYIAAPGTLHPLVETQPGGTGVAELAEDGLRFARVGNVYYFQFADVSSVEFKDGAIFLQMNSPSGYLVEVQPGDGIDRWTLLLAKHGVRQGEAV